MAALLCRTIKTYVEPPTLDHIIAGSCVEPRSTHHHLANSAKGKKIFLYRQLPSQIGAWMHEMRVADLMYHAEEAWIKSLNQMITAKDLIFIAKKNYLK